MKLSRFFELLRNPKEIFIRLGRNQLLNWMPDKTYLKIAYYCEMDKKLDLKNPKLYSEKIQWLKMNDRKPLYPILVDKYAVRQYVSDIIGEEYLVPVLGVYDSDKDIAWDMLPDKFVMKCTHSSQANIICMDKSKLDISKSNRSLQKWMKENLYWYGREWAYKSVRPRIICEQFISDTERTPDDYKVICCNGQAKLFEVHSDRYGDHRLNYYDRAWAHKENYTTDLKSSDQLTPRPDLLEEMTRLSELLIKDTYLSRVDWYIVDNKLYFGEITLYEASGFLKKKDDKMNRLFGDLCTLPTDC